MANFVSHTSASQTVDGAKGQNNKMERGGSVRRPRLMISFHIRNLFGGLWTLWLSKNCGSGGKNF